MPLTQHPQPSRYLCKNCAELCSLQPPAHGLLTPGADSSAIVRGLEQEAANYRPNEDDGNDFRVFVEWRRILIRARLLRV